MRFLLVDTIVEMLPGSNIIAEKSVSGREEFFWIIFQGFRYCQVSCLQK